MKIGPTWLRHRATSSCRRRALCLSQRQLRPRRAVLSLVQPRKRRQRPNPLPNRRRPPVRLGRQRKWLWLRRLRSRRRLRTRPRKKRRASKAIARPRKKKSRRRFRRRTIPARRNQRNLQLLRPVAARGPRLATALVAPVGPVLNRNSAGTAACCTTAFTVNGSNRRRSQRRDQKIPCWRNFESKKTAGFRVSRSLGCREAAISTNQSKRSRIGSAASSRCPTDSEKGIITT